MSISKKKFSTYIKAFQFRELFNDMGWNNDRTKQPIPVDEDIFILTGIAEKSGFRIFSCEPEHGKAMPDKSLRKKIEGKVTKLFQEHLIIFIDSKRQEQIWQLAIRKAGSPTKINETRYPISQEPELLYQRAGGLFIPIEKEETITIVDVTKLVGVNFQQNNEKVTKKFYESFKKEHTAFLKFIEGIDDKFNMDWYASLMLNRLMFCYFIQKKGFLDNNRNYLKDKLLECREKEGKDKFYSFYRDFLLVLFHKALGEPHKDLEVGIGKIPYLNGGLFDVHEIEKAYIKIQIDDKAFERLFDFFDEYEWHLDTRESSSGKDINPDVIGYIFEKYINDRADMGAYYTKEDITDYISKNCVIPWLFDEGKRNYPKAFADDSWLWSMVKESGDNYIYDAVKHGVPEKGGLFDDLPEEIKTGFNPVLEKKVVDGNTPYLWEMRKEWNKVAPAQIALPTEIYREVIERRKRYAEIKAKIEAGQLKEINDFITYNLNIRQFAQDVIETTDDPEFIRYFYKTLSSVTILDPTCGSGAFLFAAMNILEGLYETSIGRMQEFVNTAPKGKYKFFEEVLNQVNSPEHPNLQYFIYKSIILNNLYGVDIMKEAVEIAKLRLFLKLVATVEPDYKKPNLGLEPLPDVDFNIRSGNTLVGYAKLENAITTINDRDNPDGGLALEFHDELNAIRNIKDQANQVAMAYKLFKSAQDTIHTDYKDFKTAKSDLERRLEHLNESLNEYLAWEYGVKTKNKEEYQKWLPTHQPFHWFAEFYEIIHNRGGFDVIIGNPPYVKTSKIKYVLKNYKSLSGRNIYSLVIEKSYSIASSKSYMGMITPVSICSGVGFSSIMDLLFTKKSWLSSFSNRPGKLFDGVEQRLTIFLSSRKDDYCFTSPYQHWYTEERNTLFNRLSFAESPKFGSIPLKSGLTVATSSLKKITNAQRSIQSIFGDTGECWYHDGPTYWIRSLPFYPEGNSSDNSSHYHCIKGQDLNSNSIITSILASSIFYLFYKASSNCRDFGIENINNFRINRNINNFNELIDQYRNRLTDTAQRCSRNYKSGVIEYDEYYPAKAKDIIDQMDSILAQHYGFTQEELDFIISYDIKYRMGKELDTEEGDSND